MNLAKLTLLVCPAVLASMMFVASPAHAAIHLTQTPKASYERSHSELATAIASTQATSDPQIPQGCMCARCLQTVERLQGKLPGM
ncbi:MAG: hypothetical protein HC866_00735 [Leptolyngbyaceae cyanobacterium RU_5_1]|nr:hypothetical protein [Leptolyngbyaceae cyanobacterium RU_5_1]